MKGVGCFIGLHVWRRLKYGRDPVLDARECSLCGRFEAWVWSRYVERDRSQFEGFGIRTAA